jgi:hypothetical protein
MFKTRNNTPLNMNNLLNDQIRPALNRYVCGEGRRITRERITG